ncbi:MAG: aspartate kinase [Clostridiales bacterium]|nr:aspartate kinase [Clostridiales bacterium]
MIIVQKYGGTSVADAERIKNVARRIKKARAECGKVVAVLSAQGDTTDDLKAKAFEISRNPSRRELDMLLATGEQQSAALMAMALHDLGESAVSLNAAQFGLHSTSNYGSARIKRIETERVNMELERGSIVLIAGFQGVNRYGDITTLGRGASDTTAVALAAVLGADRCEIYTDVDGVYTADPRLVPSARKIPRISYEEMLELSSLGAKVLHNRSVELANKYNVKLIVRSSMTEAEGTIVWEGAKMEKMLVSGIAVDDDVSRISIVGVKDEPGVAFKIFSCLAKEKISVDMILQSIGRSKTNDISFTVACDDLSRAIETLKENRDAISWDHIGSIDRIAKLSVIGAGMATNPGVASAVFEALYDVDVNIHMISTSEIRISVLIDVQDAKRAANSIHEKFSSLNVEYAG